MQCWQDTEKGVWGGRGETLGLWVGRRRHVTSPQPLCGLAHGGGMGGSRTQSSWRAPSRAGWRKEVTGGCRGAKQAEPRGRALTARETGTCIPCRENTPCRSCCACVPAPSRLTFPSLWNDGHRPLCAGWGQGAEQVRNR